jgi:hypothetical protein
MNSTDSASCADKKKLLDISEKMFAAGQCSEVTSNSTEETESYYSDKSDLKLLDSEICDYDFDTPSELRTLLNKMWEFQNCDHMKEYAVAATVSTFHHKTEECVETGIPAFVYQF